MCLWVLSADRWDQKSQEWMKEWARHQPLPPRFSVLFNTYRAHTVLQTECFCLPKIHMWKPNPHVMVFGDGAFGVELMP